MIIDCANFERISAEQGEAHLISCVFPNLLKKFCISVLEALLRIAPQGVLLVSTSYISTGDYIFQVTYLEQGDVSPL